ncbi:MAG: diphosphomevalonate decarboxylase [Caldilineaceae bacterium]|nr:diphosphomevalonate decarboxylase [Caldilineaceae bacterium]
MYRCKATCRAHANIAFVKYWGVVDSNLNLPANGSLSMTLSHAHSTTTVAWMDGSPTGEADILVIDGKEQSGSAHRRTVSLLDRIRTAMGIHWPAHVESRNSFPASAGIASSASGFCALTVAACQALAAGGRRDIPNRLHQARLARRASGSACRSFQGGFVEWSAGVDDTTSVACQVAGPDHWPLHDVVAVLDADPKSVSSHDGHRLAATSPLQEERVRQVQSHLNTARAAIRARDLKSLGEISERDAMLMHAVMMSSEPPLLFLNEGSVALMRQIRDWRLQEGLEVYFTVDAGPNLHVLCNEANVGEVSHRLARWPSVQDILVNGPGPAPELRNSHFF